MRWTRIVCLCLCLLCGAAGVYWWSGMPAGSVSRTLSDKVHRGPGTVIDFAEVAPFAWDRVFIFHPYTPSREIDACLGFHWGGAGRSSIEFSDGINLVVFVRNGAVVCWFDHPRNEGDIMDLADPQGYARAEAKFWVRLDKDQRLVLTK